MLPCLPYIFHHRFPPVRPGDGLTARRAPGERRGHAGPGWPVLPAVALLALFCAVPAVIGAQERRFGEDLVVDQCLFIAVTDFTDRQSDLPHEDWVSTRVKNRCPFGVRNLQVHLELLDHKGKAYGRRIWLLARGEVLRPGGELQNRYAVPDPDNLAAIGWRMKVLRAQRHRPPKKRG